MVFKSRVRISFYCNPLLIPDSDIAVISADPGYFSLDSDNLLTYWTSLWLHYPTTVVACRNVIKPVSTMNFTYLLVQVLVY